MNSRVAFPFLTLPDGVVELKDWLIGDPGEPLAAVEDILEGWDYARDLEVSVDIALDFDGAAAALQLDAADLELEVMLRAGTGTGAYPRRTLVLSKQTLNKDCASASLRGLIKGRELSGRLLLEAAVTLKGGGGGPSRLSPSIRGARLWAARIDVLIEDGGQGRFPLEAISFSEAFPSGRHSSAPWFLHWQPNAWDSDFSSAARLYINSDQAELQQRVVQGDGLTLQAMLTDAAAQMITGLLQDPDGLERLEEFEVGTLGAQVREWMNMVFPGTDVGTVTSMLRHRPGEFHARLMAAMEMGVEA